MGRVWRPASLVGRRPVWHTGGMLNDRTMELRRVKASELHPHPRNWRKHPTKQKHALRAVVDEIGFAGAIIGREVTPPDGGATYIQILDGHLRSDTFKDDEVPVVVVDLNDEEADLLIATYDPLGAMAERNKEVLGGILNNVKDTQDDNLNEFLDDMRKRNRPVTIPDESSTEPEDSVDDSQAIEYGDIFELDWHRIMCGNAHSAEDVGRLLGGELAPLLVTSPPYNQNLKSFVANSMPQWTDWATKVRTKAYDDNLPEADYQHQQIEAMEVWYEFMADGASLFYNHKNRYRDKVVISPLEWVQKTRFKLRQEIIWRHTHSLAFNANAFIHIDERIYWLYKGDSPLFNTVAKSYSTVWDIPNEPNLEHSVGFPTELPRRAMIACSNQHDLVFDPYVGSGTTILAAEQTGRRGYGMELDPKNVAIAVKRWERYTGKTAHKLKAGN